MRTMGRRKIRDERSWQRGHEAQRVTPGCCGHRAGMGAAAVARLNPRALSCPTGPRPAVTCGHSHPTAGGWSSQGSLCHLGCPHNISRAERKPREFFP